MMQAKYKGNTVTVIRAANAGDGESFDPDKRQLLIRTAEGAKKIVLLSEVTEIPKQAARQ